jgi:hypothetical protein
MQDLNITWQVNAMKSSKETNHVKMVFISSFLETATVSMSKQ